MDEGVTVCAPTCTSESLDVIVRLLHLPPSLRETFDVCTCTCISWFGFFQKLGKDSRLIICVFGSTPEGSVSVRQRRGSHEGYY